MLLNRMYHHSLFAAALVAKDLITLLSVCSRTENAGVYYCM